MVVVVAVAEVAAEAADDADKKRMISDQWRVTGKQ